MKKPVVIFIGSLLILLLIGGVLLFFQHNNSKSSSLEISKPQKVVQNTPSITLKTYSDPSGFSFSYPDNLSVVKNETTDDSTYADIQLTAKGVSGNISLKIVDSKLLSLNDWVSANVKEFPERPKDTKLGNLSAVEIKNSNKLWLAALDKGVLFTMEVPFENNQEYWTHAYNIVTANFSFVSPSQQSTASDTGSSASDNGITFEGEETVE